MTMEQDIITIYRTARDLITLPEHWSQGAIGRDARGIDVHPRDIDQAVSYSALGALARAYGPDYLCLPYPDRAAVVQPLRETLWVTADLYTPSVSAWEAQPERRHDEVLDLFDQAILCLVLDQAILDLEKA